MRKIILFIYFFIIAMSLAVSNTVLAHCDTLDGPVIQDARIALEKGDVTPVLKWVKKGAEPEIRVAFDEALLQRKRDGEPADMKFFETLVRVHRAGEGADFTGLKPAGAVEVAVAKADRAIEKGSVDKLAKNITDAVFNGIKERFQKVIETKKRMNESIEAGREYVEAYVEFVHYVEGVNKLISGASAHHLEEEAMQERNQYQH